MRYVCSALATCVLLTVAAPAMFGQADAGLSISPYYQFIDEQRDTRSQWIVTYRAQVVNKGAARSGVTATVTSTVPSVQVVPGHGTVHFAPVPANSQVLSLDTFMLIVDRSVPFDFANLRWSFLNPVANAGLNQTATVGSTVTLNGGASANPGGGTLTYAWKFASRPAGSSAVLNNANTVTPSFVVDKPGDYVLTLTVDNGSAQDSANVTVSTINSPPVAKAGPDQTAAVGATVTLNGSGSFDVDGDPLTYYWSLVSEPAGSNAFIASTRSVLTTFMIDQPGTYVARLIVNDGKVDSAPSTVKITTGNTAPVANAGQNQVVNVGALVQLNGSGSSDVDHNPLTYKWSLITLPLNSAAKLSDPGAVNPTFTADVAGTYVAQLIVNDGTIDSSPTTVTITANAAAPQSPTANAGTNQTVVHGTLVTLSGSGTDPQQLPLTLAWSLTTRPAGSNATLSNVNSAHPTFVADKPGNYVAQLIVTNSASLSSTPVTVTITTTNTPPVANAGTNQNVATGSTVTLDGSGSSDADHDPLTYTWSFNTRPAGSTAALQAANSKTPTFVPDVSGTYVAQLIVNDGFADSAPVTVTITAGVMKITLTPDPLNLTNSPGTLTVNLSSPAGPNGLQVNLQFDSTVITAPSSVLVPANTSGANVSVTPKAPGSSTVTASGNGYQSGTATVNVAAATIDIIIPATLSLSPGDVVPFNVTLAKANPNATTIINLVVTDSSKATISETPIFIDPGQTQPRRQPTITAVSAGTTTVTASASGLNSATSQVTVGTKATLSPANLTIPVNTDANLTLTLSGSQASSVMFTLTSSNPGVASVPGNATVSSSQITSFKVSGISPGTAVITASAPGFPNATSNVTVQGPGSFTMSASTTNIQIFQTATLTLTLSKPAPAGGTTISLTTDPSMLTIAPANVFIAEGGTTGTAQITGANVGNPSITASAPNYTAPAPLVIHVGATISWDTPTATIVGNGQQTVLRLRFPITVPGGGPTVGDKGITINFSSSRPDVATVQPSSTLFTDFSTVTIVDVPVTSVGPGTTIIHASGINIPDVTATVTVTGPLGITTASLPNGTAGSPYTASLTTSGGAGALHWSATGLPNNLSIDPSSGQITGTPSAAGTTNGIKVTVTDSSSPALSASATYTLLVNAGAPGSITVTGGSGQSAAINTAFASPLKVVVKDATNNPISGVTVTFTAPGSGASGSFAGGVNTAVTDASGVATSAVFTANGTVGSYNVSAAASGVSTNFSLTNTPGAPASITVAGGSPQSAAINTAFASPLKALVKDAANNPVSGVTVTFTAPGSGASGTFAGGVNTAVTDASGVATSAVFTANGKAGGYNVTAAAAGLSTNFALTNTAGNPASITVVSGSGQSAKVNTAFASALKVSVMDASSNPISGVTVTFTAPGSGASGTFAGGVNTAVTDASGVATSAVFTANGTVGSYAVSAAAGGISTNFTLTNTAGDPASITVSAGSPQTAAAGATFASPLKALVKDATNNPLAGVTVTFTPPASGPSGTFASGQNTAVTDASGVATSVAFTANTKIGSYNVVAGAGSVTTNFSLTNQAGPPASITPVSGGGQSTAINTAFGSPLKAIVTDAGGNPLSGVAVTFTPPSSGASAVFVQNFTTTDASGVATSSQLSANGTAGTYNVAASVSGLAPANFTLTNTSVGGGGGGGVITVSNAIVGKDLEAPISISFNPAVPPGGVLFTITSGDPNSVLLGGASSQGTDHVSAQLAEGTTTTSITAQALAASGTVTLTATASGYANTTATITLARSGFVVSGPKGIGAPFTAFQGTSIPLSVLSGRLDGSNVFAENQPVRGGFSATVPVSSSVPAVGLLSLDPDPTKPGAGAGVNATLTGGAASAAVYFDAKATGSTDVTVGTPATFTTPSTGTTVTANVQQSGITPFSVTVGQGLERPAHVSINGSATSKVDVTLTSNDPAKLKFAVLPTDAGSQSITVSIDINHDTTPDFYVQGFASSGSVGYSVSASGFGTVNGTVNLGRSGLTMLTPAGFNTNFTDPLAAGDATLAVFTALLDASNSVVETQFVAGGTSVPVTVQSSSTGVGTLNPTSLSIVGGNDNASTLFHPVSKGTTNVSATAPGFLAAPQVTATVTGTNLVVDSGNTVPKNLGLAENVLLGSHPTDLPVTITSNSASLKLAASATDTPSSSITITVPASQGTGSFYVVALSDTGQGTYTATAPGYGAAIGTAFFAPSGIVLFPSSVSGSAGAQASVNLFTAVLDGANSPQITDAVPVGPQALSVSLQSNNPAIATVPATVPIPQGLKTANVPITLKAAGSTNVFIPAQPPGFGQPNSLTSTTVTVH